MSNIDNLLYNKEMTPLEFKFENLIGPPVRAFLTNQDIYELNKIASSLKLASNVKAKYKLMDEIMKSRGFEHFACGTNRRIYRHYMHDTFLFKVAIDRVGLEDNPNEFRNQEILKPFVAKMFDTTPCGTVSSVERVIPISNRREFISIGSDIFDMIWKKIVGKYVLEDIGEKCFMNYGLRQGFGPCLIDYPYLFEVDYDKLICKNIVDGQYCNGFIDYDIGFNILRCEKCGKEYSARSLQKAIEHKEILIEDEDNYIMDKLRFTITKENGDILVDRTIAESEIIQ